MKWINKILTKLSDKLLGVFAGALITGAVLFTTFAFNVYDIVTVRVPAIEDTIKKIEARPAKIERRVGLMENDINNIQGDVMDIKEEIKEIKQQIKDNAKQQQEDTKDILKLLIEIKNEN